MFKKFIAVCMCVFLCASAWAAPSTLVADSQSGYVLHAKNADCAQYPASLTKIMTLYVTFDALEKGYLKMNDLLPVSKHASRQPKSKLYLKEGSVMTVREAILALIVKSANDAAVVLAEGLAGSEEQFAEVMTGFAKELGLRDTTFKNASGLHDPEQVSSAKDMAILAIAIMNHFPQYYPLFATKDFKFGGRTYYSHNNILLYYQGAEGFKTGFISAVGYNIVSTATRNGRTLVGVVIGENSANKRDRKMRALLDVGFGKIKEKQAQIIEAEKNPFYKKAYISKSYRATYDPILITNIAETRQKVSKLTAVSNQNLIASIPNFAYENDSITIEQGDYIPADWSVQVGAFDSREKAHRSALKACGLLKITEKAIQTSTYKSFYRSRLSGFETKEDAEAACSILKSKSVNCLAIAPRKNM